MMRKLARLAAVAAGGAAALTGLVLLTATPAQAHPLGNFSVNQYLGLVLHRDRVEATAVVDIAEIPTLQERASIDADGDGTVSGGERAARAAVACPALAAAVEGRVGDDHLEWTITSATFAYAAGTGELDVSRLTCELTAPAALAAEATLTLTNGYLADRIGWREITARGEGLGLVDPPVPATSVSDELRAYPDDLLTSALDVRSVTLRTTPGPGSTGAVTSVVPSGGDPVSRWLSTVDSYVADLAGGPLTPAVTLIAILLAVLLGAGHAALPGHGKTVLAAYLAGRAGRPRDALTVAGTVTLTHTGGVLVLGLLVTGGSALLGERVLGWLGVVSGAVVLVVGTGMLRSVVRRRRGGHHDHSDEHGHSHGHTHSHGEPHDHAHGYGHTHSHGEPHDHAHGYGHGHDHVHGHDHGHPQRTGGPSHDHGRSHSHSHSRHGDARSGRWSLAGIGVAGGLVPSPSALVVLLAAIGLGRTAFGVLLVLAYGLGMAATLTGAGLLLLFVQRRLTRAAGRAAASVRFSRLRGLATRLGAATPAATAVLVLAVGAGLALRAATSVI